MNAHIRYDLTERPEHTSDPEWYGVGAQVGKRANERSRRSDITAVVSETCGMGAPACFIPSIGELHLNRTLVPFGNVDDVNFHDALWRLEHAAAAGALEHEAAHARHSKFFSGAVDWEGDYDATRRMVDVIVTLEEPRIEANAIRNHTDARPYLRACAMEIVGSDFTIPDTPYGASMAAALFLARVDAGVLTKVEAKPFRDEILSVLHEPVLDTLEGLWKRFLVLRDEDFAGMAQIAREWLEALDIDPEEDDQEGLVAVVLVGGSGEGESEEGEGEGEGEGGSGEGEDGKGFGDRLDGEARKVAIAVDTDVAERRGAERAARRAAQRKADAERSKESEAPHRKAFPPSHGYSPDRHSHHVGSREPTKDERIAAARLARTLEQLDYRDRVVTKTTSKTPPGRLRGRAAVTEAAYRSQGQQYAGELWGGKQRKVVDSTPLTIGFLCDVSGSMGGAQEPLGSAQYVMATAGAHVDAKVATVHFGVGVHGIMPAGARQSKVHTYHAGDGHEAFKDGVLALDRELGLINGRGARLLVVLSDGHFVKSDHRAYAEAFVPLAISRGVAVLFLDFTGSFHSAYGGTHINCVGKSPVQVADLVGKAAAEQIRRIDKAQS